ncbi:hypothetical protein BKA69DRAFT_1096527 [Paraphysoderma sedebokerense]|nr:hypothetical protein BKA69DRAFT_1096527 [Paraphysoderma sedebokerense]
MGAIHWGLAMTKYNDPESKYTQSRYLVSVTPSLVAFLSVLTPIDIQLSLQAVSFLGLLGYDLKCWKRGLVPAWYPSLRIWLTMGVVGSQAGMLVL